MQEVRDHADTGAAVLGHFRNSFWGNSPDAEEGQSYLSHDVADFCGADRFVVGLCPRGVEGAEAEVVGAERLTSGCLARGVGGEAEECGRTEKPAGFWNS